MLKVSSLKLYPSFQVIDNLNFLFTTQCGELFCLLLLKKNPSEFLVEQRAKSIRQRAKSIEQQAKSIEQQVNSHKQQTKSNKQRAKSNKQRATTKEFHLGVK